MPKKYFASANSSEGFVNRFSEIFGGCRRLYVILGGPGTGKSRFLNEVAAHGNNVEYYYCSSDAESLDGILVDGWLGLIDGTAPHIWNPTCIGAFEETVNLGAFWDSRLLMANRAEIEALSAQKRAAYAEAYAFLEAIGKAEKGIEGRFLDALDCEKLQRAASRLLRGLTGDSGERKIGFCSALSMKGEVHLDTYEQAVRAVPISDSMGAAWLLLGELDRQCAAHGIAARVAPSPLFPNRLEAIELEGGEISFFAGEGKDEISVKRFFSPEKIRAMRQELRGVREVQARLKDYASEALSRAATAHFALEEIYSEAMDFKAKEGFTERFCQELFG